MVAPSSCIKTILISAHVALADNGTGDWKAHLGKQVDAPVRTITLYDTGGNHPEARWLLNYPQVTIQVRGSTYTEAYDKISDVRSALVGINPVDISSVGRIDGIVQIGDIMFLGYDPKDRPQFSATFKLYFEPVADGFTNREAL